MNITPQEIVDKIVLGIEQAPSYRDDDHLWNRASSLGWADECLLYLIRRRVSPELEVRGPKFKAIVHEGYSQEHMMRKEFKEYASMSGAKVEDVVPMTSEAYRISGEVDNILKADHDYAIDYKSCSPQMFLEISRAKSVADLLASERSWIRHYPAQVLTYDQLYGLEHGVLYFKDKVYGGRKLVNVDLSDNKEYVTSILDAVGQVNAAINKGDIPAPVYKEACDTCGFFGTCWPDKLTKTPPIIMDSQDLLLTLSRRQELEWAAKEFEKLDKEVKPQLKELGDRFIIGGQFLVSNTRYPQTTYSVPPEVKEKYRTTVERIRTNIKNLKSAI